jgi:hypothetical protein
LLLPKSFLQEVSVWICDKCDGLFSNDNVDVLLGKIGGELSEMPKGDAKVCREFLQKYEKVLAPNHFYLLDVKMALSHILASQNFEDLSDGDLGLLLKMSEDLKIVAERVAPAERRLLGLILYRTAKSKIEMARREDNLSEFRAVLAVSGAGKLDRVVLVLVAELEGDDVRGAPPPRQRTQLPPRRPLAPPDRPRAPPARRLVKK